MALEDELSEIKHLLQEVQELQRDHHQAWLKSQNEAQKAMRRARLSGGIRVLMLALLIIGVYFVLPYLSRILPTGGLSLLPVETETNSYLVQGQHYEAETWLVDNPKAVLAPKRFGSTTEALEFVRMLYQTGATGVYVANVYHSPSDAEGESGPYSSLLIVVLPGDANIRSRLFEIYRAEAARSALEPEPDHGQNELVFWWD